MGDKELLTDMGFSEGKVVQAIHATKGSGLQQALDWLEQHADDAELSPEALAALGTSSTAAEDGDEDEAGGPGGAAEAKSLKCLQCLKTFRNHALASYHGEKSGHDQFEESTEEIKPLTEAEKAAKLEELKQRMSEKKKITVRRHL